MRPPVSAASSSVATAASTATTPVTGATFTNGTHLKSKTQFNQIDVYVENNRGTIQINHFENDPYVNSIGVVTPTPSSSSASSPSSSSNSSLLLCAPHTIDNVVGHVKNALRADFDSQVDKNIVNGNSSCIGNNNDKKYCVQFNENVVSNNKCLTSNSHTSANRRHSDSQTIRTNVDSFQFVNKFAYYNQSDSHYLNGVDGGVSTTTPTIAVYPNEYSNSTNSENFTINTKSGGRKSELQTTDNCSDSEISPLLERDVNNSIALIKNNSASLIFTKKEFSPVVHRSKLTATNSAPNNKSGCISDSGGILTSEHIQQQRRSLQFNSGFNLSNNSNNNNNCNSSATSTVAIQDRRKHAKSWYASIYTTLDEVAELDLKELQSNYNLACTKKQHLNGSRESASLLENHQPQPQLHQARARKASLVRPVNLALPALATAADGPHMQINGGQPPQPPPSKYNRFEQLLKSLVGRKVSKETTPQSLAATNASTTTTTTTTIPATAPTTTETYPVSTVSSLSNSQTITVQPTSVLHNQNVPLLLSSPEIRISKSPSEHNLIRKDRPPAASTTSLNSVQQRLWSVVPLLRREGSCSSLQTDKSNPIVHQSGMKKCQTVLTLSRSSGNLEPIKPLNRLRHSPSMATCSRCSSLLSLAANGSRYSLNLANGGFIPIGSSNVTEKSSFPRSATQTSMMPSGSAVVPITVEITTTDGPTTISTCKLCLADVQPDKLTKLTQCGCEFCTECMKSYVEFEITEGAYEISCPDALCPAQGVLTLESEIATLVSNSLLEKYQRYRLNREVELDENRTWCPRAGCETVCLVDPDSDNSGTSQHTTVRILEPIKVRCPTCVEEFCSGCKKPWHMSMTCDENARRLAATGVDDSIGIPFDSDLIKCCPMCAVPIEKDEGCAQMMCKRCKHVFCWYCLASLDDDFLLRHYDKGPCKNKLGHSRASVVWHRAQVIGIFAGFGILLLVASPLLLLAAPCIVCCKCRMCSNSSKLDDAEADFDEPTPLNR